MGNTLQQKRSFCIVFTPHNIFQYTYSQTNSSIYFLVFYLMCVILRIEFVIKFEIWLSQKKYVLHLLKKDNKISNKVLFEIMFGHKIVLMHQILRIQIISVRRPENKMFLIWSQKNIQTFLRFLFQKLDYFQKSVLPNVVFSYIAEYSVSRELLYREPK